MHELRDYDTTIGFRPTVSIIFLITGPKIGTNGARRSMNGKHSLFPGHHVQKSVHDNASPRVLWDASNSSILREYPRSGSRGGVFPHNSTVRLLIERILKGTESFYGDYAPKTTIAYELRRQRSSQNRFASWKGFRRGWFACPALWTRRWFKLTTVSPIR